MGTGGLNPTKPYGIATPVIRPCVKTIGLINMFTRYEHTDSFCHFSANRRAIAMMFVRRSVCLSETGVLVIVRCMLAWI